MMHSCGRPAVRGVVSPPMSTSQPVAPADGPDPRTLGSPEGQDPVLVPAELGQHDGVEDEHLVSPDSEITDPFDPARIRIRTKILLVQQLVRRLKENEINLAPDFQRNLIWRRHQKTRLIESLLLKIPLPVFYVSSDENDDWDVVDGIQRMSTIRDYIDGRFPLKGLEYLTQFRGTIFEDLPRRMRRRIDETELLVNIIEHGTPPEVMFNVFTRINTGGTPLKAQEIRHALYSGAWRGFVKSLAEDEPFLRATCSSIKPARMEDRECVLRFVAFYLKPWQSYETGNFDGFLRDAIEMLNKASDEKGVDRIRTDFNRAMRAASHIFGDRAFRKMYPGDVKRRPINKALFETWSVVLSRCSVRKVENVAAHQGRLVDLFKDRLASDKGFERSISAGTGSPRSVRKRFETVVALVEECVL